MKELHDTLLEILVIKNHMCTPLHCYFAVFTSSEFDVIYGNSYFSYSMIYMNLATINHSSFICFSSSYKQAAVSQRVEERTKLF